jgi:hypothetical protein
LENLVDKSNTASDVWADTAYRSAKNEAKVKIGLANLTYNMKRAIWLSTRTAPA